MSLLRVVSFNVHSDPEAEASPDAADSLTSWARRADLNVRTIARYRPHLIGFQELDRAKLATYRQMLDGYGFADPDDGTGLLPSIAWRTDRCALVTTGRFWLSRTPDRPSADWGVDEALSVEWARFRLTGSQARDDEVLLLNTQFEDGPWGEEARVNSSRLIVQRVTELRATANAPLPALLTGDFNCNPWSAPYRIFLEAGCVDTYRAAGHGDSAASSTFHGYRGGDYFGLEWGGEVFWRVDWILTLDGDRRWQTTSCTIVRDAEPPLYPSDHWPVVAEALLLP